jgi:hypothetical protein
VGPQSEKQPGLEKTNYLGEVTAGVVCFKWSQKKLRVWVAASKNVVSRQPFVGELGRRELGRPRSPLFYIPRYPDQRLRRFELRRFLELFGWFLWLHGYFAFLGL